MLLLSAIRRGRVVRVGDAGVVMIETVPVHAVFGSCMPLFMIRRVLAVRVGVGVLVRFLTMVTVARMSMSAASRGNRRRERDGSTQCHGKQTSATRNNFEH